MTKGEQQAREELREAEKQIKKQQRELERKEKALAELAAIVTLQKNGTPVSGSAGRLIPAEVRTATCELIDETVDAEARLSAACEAIGIHPRTYRRWREDRPDRRKGTRKTNARALSEEERQRIVEVCCEPEFRDKTPPQIVAILAERKPHLASARTFYQVLRAAGKLHHRGNGRPPRRPYTPPQLKATGPDQVYSWDITWIPSMVRGIFWYAYVIVDVWSREIVGWAIHPEESEEHARALFERLRLRRDLKGTFLHADNGNPMKGATFAV